MYSGIERVSARYLVHDVLRGGPLHSRAVRRFCVKVYYFFFNFGVLILSAQSDLLYFYAIDLRMNLSGDEMSNDLWRAVTDYVWLLSKGVLPSLKSNVRVPQMRCGFPYFDDFCSTATVADMKGQDDSACDYRHYFLVTPPIQAG